MARSPAVGDEAPNFDLTSTEDVVLMLRDEVPRTGVLLYFFHDADSEEARSDLVALGRWRDRLMQARTKIMAISPAKMPALKALQIDLKLRFPLLSDDRSFSAAYGVVAGDDEAPRPALFLVDRRQRVLWAANPVGGGVEAAMAQVESLVGGLASSTENYPKSVVNRLVDRWVH